RISHRHRRARRRRHQGASPQRRRTRRCRVLGSSGAPLRPGAGDRNRSHERQIEHPFLAGTPRHAGERRVGGAYLPPRQKLRAHPQRGRDSGVLPGLCRRRTHLRARGQPSPVLRNLLQLCALTAALAIISLALPMTAVKAAIPKSGTSRLHPGTAYDEVGHLAGLAPVAAAFSWFHDRQQELLDRQAELARIPAPPFGESARSQWLAARFREIGLEDIHVDEIGNVLGVRRGTSSRQKFIAITAHVDTVFPASTAVEIRREDQKLYGPGVSDNAAGVTAMLAIAGALNAANIRTEAPIVFIGNVGEEGEGDVRGMRHIFSSPRWRDAIAYTLVVDGAGTDTVVAEALGSRRFLVTIQGPGGHSWSDFGLPNPIMVLAHALEIFRRTPIPSTP